LTQSDHLISETRRSESRVGGVIADVASAYPEEAADYDYYQEALKSGFDYLVYGYWHQSYARLATEATLQRTYMRPFLVDAGGGCGTVLKGFAETHAYSRLMSIDLCAPMIEAGRKKFGFDESELVLGSIDRMPLADGAVTLVHSGQVLEHLPEELVRGIFAEFYRVLRPGGRTLHNLAALRYGEDPAIYAHPTHINVKPPQYWAEHFAKAGFIPDFESYDRFARSPHGPSPDGPNFYAHYASQWTIFAYMKP
jgi:ubiquinone/menaquinone biosynthesis C-methylase UbiE